MPENGGNKLKRRVLQRADGRADQISPYSANQNSFEIIVTLRPSQETMPVAKDFFYEKILPAYSAKKSRVLKADDKERQFFCLVCSLSFASTVKPLRVALNNNHYSKNKSLSTFTIYLVKWLSQGGYINLLTGTNLEKRGGKRWTRISPTRKLKNELLKKLIVRSDPDAIPKSSLVILRNSGKKPIWYRDTKFTKQLKSTLLEINRCNSRHRVVLPYNKRELTIICDLHCVFNNESFKDNGRFYTGALGYQNLPQEDRARLLVDGQRTVELDYSGLHPRLLYAMKGIQFEQDPYSIVTDDKNLRSILKKVLLALFNTEDYVQVVRAGNYAVFIDQPEFITILRKSNYTIKQLVEMFKEAHEPIVEYFCTEQGYNLMHTDSQIALQVLEHFTGKGEPILCVHDSFVVIERLEEELREVMDLSYRNITKIISPDHGVYTCKISKK